MDYTVHGILQVRILEWVAVPFSGDLPNPGIEPSLPHCWRILYQLSQIPGPTQTSAAQEAIPWKDTEPADHQGWMKVHSGLCPMLGQKHSWVQQARVYRGRSPRGGQDKGNGRLPVLGVGAEGLSRRKGFSQTKAGEAAFLSSQGSYFSRGPFGVCTAAASSRRQEDSSQHTRLYSLLARLLSSQLPKWPTALKGFEHMITSVLEDRWGSEVLGFTGDTGQVRTGVSAWILQP